MIPRLALTAALVASSAVLAHGQGLPLPKRGQSVDLRAEATAALAQLRELEPHSAEQALAAAYQRIWDLDPAQIDMAAIDADPPATIAALFAVQLALDDAMAKLHQAGLLTDAIANAKRRLMRAVRYLRERVIHRTAERGGQLYPPQRPALAHEPPSQPGFERYHWTVNPAYAQLPIKADTFPRTFFILNEGDMTLSAAISRATAEDNMYSHYSIGYVSDREHTIRGTTYPPNTIFTVESLIEQGVVINPFPFHFKEALLDWSTREAIFFLRDPAHQAAVDAAADEFFARARDALNRGRPLGYDFTMGHGALGLEDALQGESAESAAPRRLLDLNAFFCSGVADAIGEAAGVELFTNRSIMEQSRNTRALVISWGVDPDRSLPTPGDGDVSATLVRVAEGLATGDMLVTHYRHAILNAMFRWMDRDGYLIRAPRVFKAGARLVTDINDKTAHTILDMGLVPNGITPEVMTSMVPMHQAAEKYLKRLRAHDDQSLAETGRRLTPRELDAYLETIRPQVDVDLWFVPGAAGDYALTLTEPFPWSNGGEVVLQVRHAPSGDGYEVRRTLTRDGAVIETGSGSGTQKGMKLVVRFSERSDGHPRRQTYTLGRDGSIKGHLPLFVVEKGARD
jgi:hypothetical protein